MFQCKSDLKFLDLEGLPLFYRNILTVWQILHSKVPISLNEIKEEILLTFVVPFLITVVFWSRFLKIGKMLSYMAIRNTPTVTQRTVGNVSAKYARLMINEKSFCPPLTQSYLREQTFTPSAVYELPLKITIENK